MKKSHKHFILLFLLSTLLVLASYASAPVRTTRSAQTTSNRNGTTPTLTLTPRTDPTAAPSLESTSRPPATEAPTPSAAATLDPLPADGSYTSRDEVARFIFLYGHLPDNFMTKNEARDYGWEGGSLELILPGMRIGGDRFGNYEGLLPEQAGRIYWECDIVAPNESSRGPRRIIFSNDGLVFYTDDHYGSFTQLDGDDVQ